VSPRDRLAEARTSFESGRPPRGRVETPGFSIVIGVSPLEVLTGRAPPEENEERPGLARTREHVSNQRAAHAQRQMARGGSSCGLRLEGVRIAYHERGSYSEGGERSIPLSRHSRHATRAITHREPERLRTRGNRRQPGRPFK
jgi:hypothetical protein